MLLNEFLATHPMPGKILFAKLAGSRGLNLHKEDSDYDFMGVYVCPTKQILSLNPPPISKQHDDTVPNYQFYEVGRFAELLLVGNPNVLEMLFYSGGEQAHSPPWLDLWLMRMKFVSKTAIKQYLGYMQGQLQRLIKGHSLHSKQGCYNEKWAYHIVRLGWSAYLIARGDEPVAWFEKDTVIYDFLMDIRAGNMPWEKCKEQIENFIRMIDAIKPWPLPEKGDEVALDEWLYQIRKDNME